LKKILSAVLFCFFIANDVSSQSLTVIGSAFSIESGGTVTVKGDVYATKDVQGGGKILLNGTTQQELNLTGHTIPVLEVDNPSNAVLTSNARILDSLIFSNGKIFTGANNFFLGSGAIVSGAGTGKFIETNGFGQVFKEVVNDLVLSKMPVGSGDNYRPVFISTSGTYSAATVGVKSLSTTSANQPPMVSDYLKTNWSVTRKGISGTLAVTAQYNEADVSGTKNNLRGYIFDGMDWSSSNETHNATLNQFSIPVSVDSANITAMDKFDILKAKAFLQAAYVSGSNLMSDKLRKPTNLIPLSDPYRVAPYNNVFVHVNNPVSEVADASVFEDQSNVNDDIVDWVFLELRNNATPGNSVLQTRSALLQRDGDIVDINGTSAVTFNNVPSGNYTIAIRHRNHLGISTDPATFTPLLDEKNSTSVLVDFTTTSDIYGTTSAANAVATDGKKLLWSGNSNLNSVVNYNGFNNDKDYILSNLNGDAANNLFGIYSPIDLNLDAIINYNGFINDKDFLFQSLGNSSSGQRKELLPN
jgi:hypothetical protein